MVDIEAAELAKELGIDVPTLLRRADAAIDAVWQAEGALATSGMTTRVKPHGQTTSVVISPKLADALRKQKTDG